MPQYDDSKFVRKEWTRPGRDVVNEIQNHASERFQNFHWGRVALVAVPAATALAGLCFLADHTLGEQERVEAAPKIPLAEVAHQLQNCHSKHFHLAVTHGDRTDFPRYFELTGFATLDRREEIQGTNGNFVVRTYLFSDDGSAQLSNTNFPAFTTTNISTANSANWPVFIQTKASLDRPSPFDQPLGDRQGPVPISVIVGISDHQLSRTTNSATFRVIEFRDAD